MPRARWWVIAALAVVTVAVVTLDVTGVIFDDPPDPPPPLSLPTGAPADEDRPAAVNPEPGSPDPAMLRRVERLLGDDDLGRSVHAMVAPLADPMSPWTERSAAAAATPASTLKLWTAAAVLDAFALDERLSTSVVWDASSKTLVLIGGGDATLRTRATKGAESHHATLTELARRTARSLDRSGIEQVRVAYDATLFTGPAVSPDWEPTYVTSGVIAPVTALMVDQGMIDPPSLARSSDPAETAAVTYAELLDAAGVTVSGRQQSVSVTDHFPDSEEIARVESPPVGDLVEGMLRDSDNQLAEALGRLAAERAGFPASFEGAGYAIEAAAESRGVDLQRAEIVDASGLSRADRLTAAALVDALHFAASEPDLSPILSGLAVAGFDGTLADRFNQGAAAQAAGVVRAKTGTLTGISSEAGITTTCDGTLVSYAFVADAVPDTAAARSVLDRAAAQLAVCP
ncbi:MAG TPA: D-alanyl-D-alanine carboxypeptidase/D-alanyl-D-alanine-endopeptidase [Actinomycetes bacterium]|nr:D-alanyl-D-alanine carboxypeptidase/D-alanyl-D-alanine-endopeptidase [Actinomycetes bacterium]